MQRKAWLRRNGRLYPFGEKRIKIERITMQEKRKKITAGVLTVFVLAFIWGNSCLSGENSSAVSGFAGQMLAHLFGPRVLEATAVLRKVGHFTEFACLGGLLGWNARLYRRGRFAPPALAGLLVAMADETIQRFVPGRASMVTDVWIDFGGVLAGLAIYALLSRRK